MNVDQLLDALAAHQHPDSLRCGLTRDNWLSLSPFLAVRYLRTGEEMIREGEIEREVYFIAEGDLQVSIRGNSIATISPGSVVGEGAFFSGEARGATVTPLKSGVAWCLGWERFEAMSRKHPELALTLTMGLAAILAIRMREALLVGHFN